MLKNLSQLQCKVGEKHYQFSCDIDSSLTDVKEALFQFQKYIGTIEDNIKSQQEKMKAEEEAKKLLETVPEVVHEQILA
jgi:hypothetical protein